MQFRALNMQFTGAVFLIGILTNIPLLEAPPPTPPNLIAYTDQLFRANNLL